MCERFKLILTIIACVVITGLLWLILIRLIKTGENQASFFQNYGIEIEE